MPTPKPSPILDGLNDAQRAVVTAGPGPVLVVAGAGSGKTTTLVRRVAWLIEQGVAPASILLLTFTRAAAANMLDRARALAPAARDVTGGTFHSVGSLVIRQLHDVFGLPERFTVLDPEDVEQALKSVMAEEPTKGKVPRASTVAAVLSRRANTRGTIEDALRARAPEHLGSAAWLEAVARRYTAWKLDRALLDYDDLLVWFAEALADPEVGAHLRARWPQVLVDEHQDSNALQLDIVYGLAGEGGSVMVVGDPAQAIYGFRGAAPATLFHFRERFPGARVLPLEVNYRSTQPVLDLVNAVDRAMSPRFDRVLRAAGDGTGPRPELLRCPTDRAQAEEVVRRVLAGREEGIELAEQAVLVRSMWAARAVEAELVAQRVPYRVVGGLRIDEAAHVKDLLSLARVADNPRFEPAWVRVLGRLPGVGPASAKKVLDHVLAGGEKPVAERLVDAPWPRKADPEPLVRALRAFAGDEPVAVALRAATEAFEPAFRAQYGDEWRDRRRDLDTVAGLAEGQPTLTSFLAMITLDYSLDARERGEAAPRADEKPLTLSTIHSAKGLEWHTVHLVGLVEGHIPSPYAGLPEEIQEELRIFYVATSRARRRLLLYRPVVSDEGWLREQSPFEELVAPYVDRVDLTRPPPRKGPELTGVRLDMRKRLLG